MRSSIRLVVAACLAVLPALPALTQDSDPQYYGLAPDRTLKDPFRSRKLRRRIDRAAHVALDSMGRIVVTGRDPTTQSPLVARFLADGSVDASFGDHGIASLPLRNDVETLLVDAQDRVVVVGSFEDAGGAPHCAARLDAAGALDLAFGGDGLAETTFGPYCGYGRLGADGASVYAVASETIPVLELPSMRAVHILADGTQDPAYSTGASSPLRRAFGFTGVAVDSLGRMVLAEDATFNVYGDPVIVSSDPTGEVLRLTADGSFDPSFGDQGHPLAPSGRHIDPAALTIDAQNRIVMLQTDPSLSPSVGLHRFLPDGDRDDSFGVGGHVSMPLNTPARTSVFSAQSVLTPKDAPDRIVIAGIFAYPQTRSFSLTVHDPGASARFGSFVGQTPDASFLDVLDVAVAADGSSAVVLTRADTADGGSISSLQRIDLALRAEGTLPDIRVQFVSLRATRAHRDQIRLRASLLFRNAGTANWLGDPATFHLVRDESDEVLLSRPTPLLVPGGRARSTFRFTIPAEGAGRGAKLRVVVPTDPGQEANPSDNQADAPIRLRSPTPSGFLDDILRGR